MSEPIKYQIWIKANPNVVPKKPPTRYVFDGYVASGYVDLYDDSNFQG